MSASIVTIRARLRSKQRRAQRAFERAFERAVGAIFDDAVRRAAPLHLRLGKGRRTGKTIKFRVHMGKGRL